MWERCGGHGRGEQWENNGDNYNWKTIKCIHMLKKKDSWAFCLGCLFLYSSKDIKETKKRTLYP